MTRSEAIAMLRRISSYLTAGNPVWRNEPIREACNMAIEALTEKEPSAEPQRKRGQWVFDERAGGYFCSECGRETYDRHDAPFENPMFGKGIALVLPYYCGYCGAKMEGERRADDD